MRAIIVYESMFGNTHRVAEAVAEGLREYAEVTVVPVAAATEALVADPELVVVGGPTHVHGMSGPLTRQEAVRQAGAPDSGLTLEPNADGKGVREWIETAGELPTLFAAFDTRADAFKWLTGSAATQISKHLKHRDRTEVFEPGSFLVPDNDIDLSEIVRAKEWGAAVGRATLDALGLNYNQRSTAN